MSSNTKTQTLNKLEQHELDALGRWIRSHGGKWKAALRDAWFTGKYLGLTPGRDRDETTLHGLRYKLGPRGLDKITKRGILSRLADRKALDDALAERLKNLRGGRA